MRSAGHPRGSRQTHLPSREKNLPRMAGGAISAPRFTLGKIQMADLKSSKELLSEAAGILDTAATEIRDIPLNPTKENIYRIGKALDLIFEVQHQIYKVDPGFEPEYLKRSSPFPTGVDRKFGEILLQATDLCDD